MKIANQNIGGHHRPYTIAEASCNHVGKIDNARRLIRAAKRAGADAVKFQAYTADTITLNCNKLGFIIQDGLWRGQTLHELYSKTGTPFEWFPELFKIAMGEGITIFASVFDRSSVDMLEQLGCPAFKIASFEIVDTPLIEYAASTKKPLIISTGLASDREVLDANEASGRRAAFLHCTSDYPGTVEGADLGRIWHLDKLLEFKNHIGISDHTPHATDIPIAATALRAAIIEKHLKLESDVSEDDTFSINPTAFKAMVDSVHSIYEALKERPVNGAGKQFRRSLYAVDDIKEGDLLTDQNIRSIRPGFGLPPDQIEKLLGKKARKNFRKGDPITL